MRVFIACADRRLRNALLLFLDYQPGIVVGGITDRLRGLLAQVEISQPDIILLEWEMPYPSMVELLASIHQLECAPRVILLSSRPADEEKMLAAGVDHFIAENAPPDDLLPFLSRLMRPVPARECKSQESC